MALSFIHPQNTPALAPSLIYLFIYELTLVSLLFFIHNLLGVLLNKEANRIILQQQQGPLRYRFVLMLPDEPPAKTRVRLPLISITYHYYSYCPIPNKL